MKKKVISVWKIITGAALLAITLFPFWYLFFMALMPVEEIKNSRGIFHGNFTCSHFIRLFEEADFGVALENSLINSGITLVTAIAVGLSAAYILARKRFRFAAKKPLTIWVLLIRVLPPVAFVIPLYTMFNRFHLLGSRMPIILACILINIPLIIWFMMTFFRELPEEIEESGKIDGASEWQLYKEIILPLVLPGIAAIAMLTFIYSWNEYTYSVIFTRSPSDYTIPLALAVLNSEDNVTDFGLVAAGGVFSFVPIALFVVFAQNYLISGLSSGAVKE